MRYRDVTPGIFLERPNRFIALVETSGGVETVHVKNTGRCRELLVPGARVYLEPSENPRRRTRFDLIAVVKPSTGVLFNIDSAAPNKVAAEWLARGGYSKVVPEYSYGSSRIDFYMEGPEGRHLMEVKGCTLEVEGVGYFPDAPTERGVKHLRELARAASEGYNAALAFVVQMEGVTQVLPNAATHPEFGAALAEARIAGVDVIRLLCRVEPGEIEIIREER